LRRFLLLLLVVLAFSLLSFRWRQWAAEIRSTANSLVALAIVYTGTAVVLRVIEWILSRWGNPELGHSIGHAPWVQGMAAAIGLVCAFYVRIRYRG
jgi:predicted ABC-type exoprotein transport system permease subunit